MTRAELAIETSSHRGQIALARTADAAPHLADLPQARRHNLELMPTIDAAFDALGLTPTDLAVVYLSVGPGSFTGLRAAVVTAKMLALTLGARLVALPTLDVLARNAPPDAPHVACCLNHKRGRAWSALYGHDRTPLTDPARLEPLYAREPEAVTKWRDRRPDPHARPDPR